LFVKQQSPVKSNFQPSEAIHAWHWVKTAKFAEDVPVRELLPPGHLMSGYDPEYTEL
jgi:hypothetical protein